MVGSSNDSFTISQNSPSRLHFHVIFYSIETDSLSSARFISWDLATSEICRDIDPEANGIMLGMDILDDNRYAAAFTRSVACSKIRAMFLSQMKWENAEEERKILEQSKRNLERHTSEPLL